MGASSALTSGVRREIRAPCPNECVAQLYECAAPSIAAGAATASE